MQPLEIDSAVFCDGAHYTIISRENSSILTCPVTSGAGGYTLNRVGGSEIDREIGGLTGHAACIAVDVPTWCRIAGDPLDAVADALADLLDETPTRFELEQLAAASPSLTANTPGIPVFPGGIAPAANSYTLAGCCRAALVRGLSSPELYATALMAAETAISTARRFGGKVPEAIGTSEGLFSATIGIGGIDTAEIGVNCVDARSDGGALIAGAVDGVVPAIDGHNTPYIVAMGYDHPTRNWEDCTLFDDIVKAKLAYEGLRGREYPLDVAMRRDDSATLNARALTDAELAIEIEKAGAAMVEHVDAHMAHVHGLGGSEDDSAAYYAARKRHADLRLEKDRRLHASIDLGQREGPREPQAMAAAAAKAALKRDGVELGRSGKKQ